MNYFVFLPASKAKNSKDNRRSIYKSDYLDIRLKRKMSDEESVTSNDNEVVEHQPDEEVDEEVENGYDGRFCVFIANYCFLILLIF